MEDNRIGLKIKELRLAQKLTLKELSEKTDLSIGFLSMVERGVTSVALVSLNRIAEALNADISTFFVENRTSQTNGFFRSYDKNIRSISGHYIYTNLSDRNPAFSLDPILITLLPGQHREDVPLMTHPGEDFVYVLEGVLTYFLDGQEYSLCPGDCHHGFGDMPHNFANLSNNIVKALYVVTPTLYGSSSVDEGRNIP